jgi:flagellar hook assembly protein FlgD
MILEKPTLVEEGQQETPKRFELFDSFPNPFNNQAVIRYRLEKTADVSLAIYNLLGQRVRTLVRGKEQSGSVTVIWDGKDDRGGDLSSGIYFCRLQAGESSQTKKLVLLK